MTSPNKSPLRVAFADTGGPLWTGGLTYQRNLLEAIRQYAPQVEVYLLTEQNLDIDVGNASCKVITYPTANSRFSELISNVTRWLSGYDFLLWRTLRAVPDGGVDLLFPGRFTVGRQTALLGWIPDFQHIHLPEMYTQTQVIALDKKYKQWIRRSTLVILSSRDAEKDFRQFAPEFVYKVRVVNFVAHVPALLYETDPETVVLRYNLPKKFFYMPNQFWKHKNHVIVLEALKLLRDRGVRPFVVFTGNPVDSRHPTYFAELMEKISLWGLREQVAFLGLVPHGDVYLLIRQSICVLNPSLFEGWSTTVEEAKSVGKRVLLSNLAVHREQDPPTAVYFDPHDAEDLANKLGDTWTTVPPGPDIDLELGARETLPARMRNYAETFVSIAREAVDMVRR